MLSPCLEGGLNFKGSQGNVLTFALPLIIGGDELKRSVSIAAGALEEVSRGKP